MSYIDLHTHTTASDGTDTPSMLVQHALQCNLSAIAITDHDTVDGVNEGVNAAQNTPLTVIPGIELSCQYKNKEIHMLGYFIDINDKAFLNKLEQLKQGREQRNEQMRQKLEQHGMSLTMEQIQNYNPNTVITRAHFARALVEAGYIKTKDEAFSKYIGDDCPCYVEKPDFSPEDAIKLVRQAGGVAVLAHPLLYKLGYKELEEMIGNLKDHGLTGVEVYHSSHNISNSGTLRELIRPYDLLPTGGSDYHGNNKQNVRLGTGYGGMRVSHVLLDDLKRAWISLTKKE